MYYVYADYTSDGRPFYVGKGNHGRVKSVKRRNRKWNAVAAKHGLVRNIMFQTLSEATAFEHEISLIAALKTFHFDDPSGIGSNFTRGGDGPGKSEACREKIANSLRGSRRTLATRKKISRKLKGRKLSPEHIARMSAAQLGKPQKKRSAETRHRISVALTGRKLSESTRQKMKQSQQLVAFVRRLIKADKYVQERFTNS